MHWYRSRRSRCVRRADSPCNWPSYWTLLGAAWTLHRALWRTQWGRRGSLPATTGSIVQGLPKTTLFIETMGSDFSILPLPASILCRLWACLLGTDWSPCRRICTMCCKRWRTPVHSWMLSIATGFLQSSSYLPIASRIVFCCLRWRWYLPHWESVRWSLFCPVYPPSKWNLGLSHHQNRYCSGVSISNF